VKRMGSPRPLPAVAGAKTKNFPYLSSFLRRGVWGEPTKNGKEIFGFASPLHSSRKDLLIYFSIVAIFCSSFPPSFASVRGAPVSAFGGNSSVRSHFANTSHSLTMPARCLLRVNSAASFECIAIKKARRFASCLVLS